MVWKKKLRSSQYTFNSERVFLVATQPGKSIYSCLQTTKLGLTLGEVQERQSIYGRNEVIHEQKKNPFILFIRTFINPFIGVLTGLAIISLFCSWMTSFLPVGVIFKYGCKYRQKK